MSLLKCFKKNFFSELDMSRKKSERYWEIEQNEQSFWEREEESEKRDGMGHVIRWKILIIGLVERFLIPLSIHLDWSQVHSSATKDYVATLLSEHRSDQSAV